MTSLRASSDADRSAEPGRRGRRLAPPVALAFAGALLAISLFLPYFQLTLVTPAHADELRLVSYIGHLDGPVELVLAAAGVRSAPPLRSLSQLERSLAVAMGTVVALLLVAATFVQNRWAALLALPAFCFPAIVLADTARWLRPIVDGLAAGTGGPAPLFLPLFGRLATNGTVLAFEPGAGLALAFLASLFVAAGLWLHRRAYRSMAGEG